MRYMWLLFYALLISSPAWSQQSSDILMQESVAVGEGWMGFTDVRFLLNAFLTLSLAVLLSAVIAFHPKHGQTADTLEEIAAPQIFIMYSVIGAIIGILVVKYGLVVGFVLFGIGGLIRFRTVLRSASLTGRVIFVTLIGLSCGLDLPHVAVLATAFGFVLVYIMDANLTYKIDIKALPREAVPEAVLAYRTLLEDNNAKIMSEKKFPSKGRITFIFRGSRHITRQTLEDLLASGIEEPLRGSVDWEVD